MCRNIKPLFNFDPPVTETDVRASALQYVRKVSGYTYPSKANEAVFDRAVQKVVAASSNLALDAPEGNIKLHASNHHTWKHARIGVARPDGQFDILHESPLIEPNPFPKL